MKCYPGVTLFTKLLAVGKIVLGMQTLWLLTQCLGVDLASLPNWRIWPALVLLFFIAICFEEGFDTLMNTDQNGL